MNAIRQAVKSAFSDAGASPDDLKSSVFGLSGLDWCSDEKRLRKLVQWPNVKCPQILFNDAFAALCAGSEENVGVIVAAGTGVTIAGRNREGETVRTLGQSYPLDDWGSARDLARAVVNRVACAYTGRGPDTSLSEKLVDLSAASDIPDFLEKVSRKKYDLEKKAWDITRTLFQESRAGDVAAIEVVKKAGQELGKGAVSVIRRLEMESEGLDVVLAGGVFGFSSPLLFEELTMFVTSAAPMAKIIQLNTPVVVGSVLLAMKTSGLPVANEIRRSLEQGAICRLFEEERQ